MLPKVSSVQQVLYAVAALTAALMLALIPFLGLTPDETRAHSALLAVVVLYTFLFVHAQANSRWSRVAPFLMLPYVLFITLGFAIFYRTLHIYWIFYFALPVATALLFGTRWAYLVGALSVIGFLSVEITEGMFGIQPVQEALTAGVLLIFTFLSVNLTARARRRAQEGNALAALATAMSQSLALQDVLETAVEQVVHLLGVEVASVFTVEGERLMLRAYRGLSPEFVAGIRNFKVGEGITGRVAQTGKAEIITARVRRDPRLTREVVRRSEFEAYAGVPIKAHERVVGVLNLATRQLRWFSADDLAFFSALANQLATAIENARLYEESQARGRRLALLNEFAAFVNRESDLKTLLSDAQRLVVELIQLKTAWITLRNDIDDFTLTADHNLPPALTADDKREMRWRPCRCQRMLLAGELTESVNIVECERFERAGVKAHHATVPLKSGDIVLGLLNVVTPSGESLGSEDLQTLGAMGAQLGVAVERARLHEQVKARRIEEQAALLKLSQALVGLLEEDAILDRAAETVQEMFHPTLVSLMLPDERREHLILRAGRGWEPEMYGTYSVDIATSREGYAFVNGKAVWLEDVQGSARFPCPRGLIERNIHSSLTAPLNGDPSAPLGAATLGTLCAHFREPRAFSDDDVRLLSLIANPTAVACERARHHHEALAHIEALTTLNQLAERITSTTDLDALLQTIADSARELAHAQYAALGVANVEGRLTQFITSGMNAEERARIGSLPQGRGLLGALIQEGKPTRVCDISSDPRSVGFPPHHPPMTSFLGVPIASRDRIVGNLYLTNKIGAAEFSAHDQNLVKTLAAQAAIAIENARLFEETRRRANEFAILYETTRDLVAHHDVPALLRTIVERAARLLNASSGAIYLYDAARGDLALNVSLGFALPGGTRLEMGEGLAGRIAQTRQPLIVGDYSAWEYRSPQYAAIPFTGIVGVPLVYGDELVGVLSVSHLGAATRRFTDADVQLLSLFASQAAAAVHSAHLFAEEQDRRGELAALYDLSRDLAEAAYDADALLNLVARRAVETIHTTFARIALVENGECVVRAAYPVRVLDRNLGVGRREATQTLPTCSRVAQQNAPVVLRRDDPTLTDLERHALFLDLAQTLCLVPLRVGERALGLLMLGEARGEEREPFTAEKIRLARSIGDQAASALHRAELFAELERAYLQTVLALASAVDAKDTYTADHAQRLAEMALAVGQALGMSPRELEDLRYGAILHDIGKIGVPDAILKKPAKLDAEEWQVMRQHPTIGARILAPVSHLAGASQIVRHHHERYDGKGYPDGLAGEVIPLGARILTVVDSYSAIVDKRVYKAARSQDDAVAELKKHAGAQFDPRVVETFLGLLEREHP